ncbi:MAG: type II toxin-antitoxin system VapC family toxin [Deltaproteobacteria bacterium]|nr:type II toxin-antitoxin system VapC family toxin [Deltaproteobacteria bacterium]
MRFWDSSALIPLVLAERSTTRVKRWLREDPDVIVWALTRVELLSALARRRREEPESAPQLLAARRDLLGAWEQWSEVTAVELVRRYAERVVETHPLRAADALQIAAALVAAEGDPATIEFVSLDRNLAEAAEREGFGVLGPQHRLR